MLVKVKSWWTSPRALLLYMVGTLLLLLASYAASRNWKGYTAPEEVDLGAYRSRRRGRRRAH